MLNSTKMEKKNQPSYLGICGIAVPSSWTKLPPALITARWWSEKRACLDVVGVSLAAPSAFFSGENSSSRSTSHTAKSLSHCFTTESSGGVGEYRYVQRAAAGMECSGSSGGWGERKHKATQQQQRKQEQCASHSSVSKWIFSSVRLQFVKEVRK